MEELLKELIEQQKITNQMLFLPAMKAMGGNITLTDPEGAEELVLSWIGKIGWPED